MAKNYITIKLCLLVYDVLFIWIMIYVLSDVITIFMNNKLFSLASIKNTANK